MEVGIPHRDISIENIILTEIEDDGFLIDLDLAVKVKAQQSSGTADRTEAKVFFLAIGALLSDPNSFMHALESFQWEFFWIFVHYQGLCEDGKVDEERTRCEKLIYKDPDALAESKSGAISRLMFRSVDKQKQGELDPFLIRKAARIEQKQADSGYRVSK